MSLTQTSNKRKQEMQVIERMIQQGSITSMDAFWEFGITRLAAVIFNAKKHGYEIETVMEEGLNRYGDPKRYARYIYRGKK